MVTGNTTSFLLCVRTSGDFRLCYSMCFSIFSFSVSGGLSEIERSLPQSLQVFLFPSVICSFQDKAFL